MFSTSVLLCCATVYGVGYPFGVPFRFVVFDAECHGFFAFKCGCVAIEDAIFFETWQFQSLGIFLVVLVDVG